MTETDTCDEMAILRRIPTNMHTVPARQWIVGDRDDVAFFFKQSSARQPERGTALTVKNKEFGVYEQREIREMPEFHPAVTRRGRRWSHSALAARTKAGITAHADRL